MTAKESISLMQVITKIRTIAERDYNNKIYDNILAIFNQLMVVEKKILLKGLINICFIIDDKTMVDTADLNKMKELLATANKSLATGFRSIEEYNELELIKLKTWLIKAASIGGLVLVVCFTIVAIVINSHTGSVTGIFNDAVELLKIIFVP